MAALLGERVGETVGYSVRGDRKVSAATRIEVVTSGLLVRRVQSDPELPGVSTILLDECHERHLDADLLLALLLDVRAGLRDDLRLLATSATVASGRLAALLGDAPVLTADARMFPVEVSYHPGARGERIEATGARTIRSALSEVDGDVLAFLPGVGEIARVSAMLSGVDVFPLHGRLTAAQQDLALRQGERQRVVLATAVAESSLTVPGVRAVVDSGLARVPRVDHRRGLPGLATVRVSAAVSEQRARRAGREAPGRAYRCWAAHEQASLPAYPEPEIRTAELARFALELACWSTPDGSGLTWWDPPGEGALAAGRALLVTLGATNADGTVTARGRKMAGLGLHPRLARALLDGARSAAEVVALLDADGTLTDVEAEIRRLRSASERRNPGSPVYLMAGGTAAELPSGSGLGDTEWLAVAETTRDPGRVNDIVRLAARADEQLAVRAAPALLSEVDEVTWSGDVVARSVRKLGAIVLSEHPLRDFDAREALLTGLRTEGLGLLK